MSMIKCGECGGEVSDKADACPHCGNPMQRQGVGPGRKSGGLFDLGANLANLKVILVLAIIGVAFYLFLAPPSCRETTSNVYRNVTKESQTLWDETVEVPDGGWLSKGFTLNVEAKVELTVEAVSGPPLNVYLMTPDQHTKFQEAFDNARKGEGDPRFEYMQSLSRLSVRSYTEATVLPPGTYHLVFNSTGSGKLFSSESTRVKRKVVLYP